jgi:hypothetical protein
MDNLYKSKLIVNLMARHKQKTRTASCESRNEENPKISLKTWCALSMATEDELEISGNVWPSAPSAVCICWRVFSRDIAIEACQMFGHQTLYQTFDIKSSYNQKL